MKKHARRASDHIHRLFSNTQVRQDVGARTTLVARAFKVLNNGFAGTARMLAKKSLGYGDVRNSIGWFVEPVPFASRYGRQNRAAGWPIRVRDQARRLLVADSRKDLFRKNSSSRSINTSKSQQRDALSPPESRMNSGPGTGFLASPDPPGATNKVRYERHTR